MSFLQKTLMTFGTKILLFVLGMFTSILTARILGPEGKGIVAIAFLVPNLTAALGGFSIGSANVFILRKKIYKLIDVFSNSVVLPILLSLVYISLFFLFFGYLQAHLFKEITPFYVFLPIFALPISLFIRYGEGILRGLYKIKEYNIATVVNVISYVFYLVIFIVLLKLSVLGAIIAMILGFLTKAFFIFFNIIKTTKIQPSLNTQLFKYSFQFGIKEHIGNVAQKLNLRLDVFFITSLWGPSYVGFYSVSVAIAELIWYIPDSIGVVLFPKISSLDKENANKFTPFVCRLGVLIAIICSVFLAAVSKIAITLMYGEKFLPSVEPLLFLLPGVLFLTIGKILSKYTSGIGKPQYNTYSSLAAFAFNIILLVILVPKYNIVGAAIATSVAYFIFAVTITYLYIKESGNGILETFIIKPGDIRFLKGKIEEMISNRTRFGRNKT